MNKETLTNIKVREVENFINDMLLNTTSVSIKVINGTEPATEFTDEYIKYSYIDFKVKKSKKRGKKKFTVSKRPVSINLYSEDGELILTQKMMNPCYDPYLDGKDYTVTYDEFPPTVTISI